MKSSTKPHLARLALLAATLAWGSTFLITKNTLDAIDTFYLLAIRFSGAALLLGLVFHRSLYRLSRTVFTQGALMGIFLFAAYVLQTEGLKRSTPGKTAFLSAIYCVAVPFLGWVVGGRRPTLFNLSAALLCLGGIGCVSLEGSFAISAGDLLTLGCGFFFAVHILFVAQVSASQENSVIALTVVQFSTAALLAWGLALCFNTPPAPFTPTIRLSLVYLCVVATALAFLCQNAGQRHLPPATASLLLSLEAVFGVICAVLFAHEPLTPQMLLGFGLILASVLVAEVLPNRKNSPARPQPPSKGR